MLLNLHCNISLHLDVNEAQEAEEPDSTMPPETKTSGTTKGQKARFASVSGIRAFLRFSGRAVAQTLQNAWRIDGLGSTFCKQY
ncbi:hypothetical protein [Paraburkholderia sediminicola]|uniref:hypothetical protein n=1 Tax=Paraburkholderia sediminicola TaxID=458836 RepID=UPI0038BBA96F